MKASFFSSSGGNHGAICFPGQRHRIRLRCATGGVHSEPWCRLSRGNIQNHSKSQSFTIKSEQSRRENSFYFLCESKITQAKHSRKTGRTHYASRITGMLATVRSWYLTASERNSWFRSSRSQSERS